MKNFILTAFAVCLGYFASTGQTKNALDQKQSALAEKQALLDKKSKKKLTAGSPEYNDLKAKGLLNNLENYEIVYDITPSKALQLSKQNSTNKTQIITSCDTPPITGPDPFGPGVLDDIRAIVPLQFQFCFYGVTYNSVNVYDNGNVQFSTNSIVFTSTGFPNTTDNMIAPFWADGKLHNPVGGLKYGKVLIDNTSPTHLVVSWDSLPYYQATVADVSKLNSFQLVLTEGTDPILPFGKNVGFYYHRMDWTTGNASTGTGGFPTTQPGNPATVGINEGNGTDYFLIGRFGLPGAVYNGPTGGNSGVKWLEGQRFYFDACPAPGDNIAPFPTLIPTDCDTFKVCGNDTLYLKNTYLAPEIGQSMTVTAVCNPTGTNTALGSSFSYSTFPNPNGGNDLYLMVDGNTAPASSHGYHFISISVIDNGTPIPKSTTQNFVIFVNKLALNNLNGSIAINPNIGACPGGVVTTSVTVTGGVPDNYLWSNGDVNIATTYTTVVPSDSIIFVTLESSQCQKTIASYIHINPVPTPVISGNLSYCFGSAVTTLTVADTNPLSQPGAHSYNWATNGTGTIGAPTASVTSLEGGAYTVTVTNAYNCIGIATTTVVVSETPSFSISTNAMSTGSVYCANQDTARISLDYLGSSSPSCGLANSNCTSPSFTVVGNGTANSNAQAVSPFTCLWARSRHQYLFTATELATAGVGNKISSIAFDVNSTGTETNYPNYTVKIKCTSATDASVIDNTGLVQVYNNSNLPITTGANVLNFNQSYVWDGTSNLLLDVCFDEVPTNGTNASVKSTNVGFTASYATYDDDPGSLCGANGTFDGTNNIRPNITFGTCAAQQSPSQFDITVTPTVGVVISGAKDSIKIDLPSTPGILTYTVHVFNPIAGCFKDTVISINTNVGVTNATFSVSSNTVCIGSPVVLTAGGANTYTMSYIQGGTPVQLTTGTTFTHVPVQAGLNVYTLTAAAGCGAPAAGYTVGVYVNQMANLTLTPLQNVTKCLNKPYVISTGAGSTNPTNTGTPYTYAWTTLPGNVPASGVNNASSYTANSNLTQTLVVTVTGNCAVPATSTVVVNNFVNDISITINDSISVCANNEFNLHSTVTGGYPDYNFEWLLFPNTVSLGSGTNLTAISPATEGVYLLTVNVVDSCGYSDSDNQLITVLPPCTVEIPNVVSANGDGVNDRFIIKNIEFHANTSLTIYDRWGRVVFTSTDYKNEWKADGVSPGTYFYVVDVPDDKKYNGFITVFKEN